MPGSYCRASSTFASCNDIVCSDTHTCSSRESSHTQMTASIMSLQNEDPIVLHVVLPVAHNSFRTDPHARLRILDPPSSLVRLPLLPILRFCPPLHQHRRTQHLSEWRCPSRTCPPRMDNPGLFHDVFSLVRVRLLAIISAFGQTFPVPFREKKRGSLFFPFRCTDWRNSVRLVLQSPITGSRCQDITQAIAPRDPGPWRHMPPSVIRARRQPKGIGHLHQKRHIFTIEGSEETWPVMET